MDNAKFNAMFREYVTVSPIQTWGINWINAPEDKQEELIERGLKCLTGNIETFAFWQEFGPDKDGSDLFNVDQDDLDRMLEEEEIDHDDHEKQSFALYGFNENGSFYEYGLCFDFVEATFENDGYYRYQISWGGPSSEFRFYHDHIEFVFLDWFIGVGFNVSAIEEIKNVEEWFIGCEAIDWKNKEDYEIYSHYHNLPEDEEDREE